MRLIVDVRPEGRRRTASPGLILPLAISPLKPRNSWFGRFTHCTAMRKGEERRASWSSDIDSRWSRRAGPRYQGVAEERAGILSRSDERRVGKGWVRAGRIGWG